MRIADRGEEAMTQRPARLADSRGQPVRLCFGSKLPPGSPFRTRTQLVLASSWMHLCWVLYTAAAGCLSALKFSMGQFLARQSGEPKVQVFDVAAPLALAVGAWLGWFLLQPRFHRWAVDSVLRLGRCPACTYDIGGLRVESDGCTVCPECGAAWRLA